LPPYKTLENPALVKALAHPLRAKMLYALQERQSSPKELAAHFGVPLSNVAYHIQVLRKLKLIRLAKKTPRRGAVEHHYVVDHVAYMYADAWSKTPTLIKERAVAEWLEDVGVYVTDAAATGGFNRSNAHLSRSRLVLDEEGWDVVSAKLEELVELVDEVEKESAERLKRADHQGERATGLVMLLFESAPSVPGADAATTAGPTRHHDEAPHDEAPHDDDGLHHRAPVESLRTSRVRRS
jgi:DNA-binding transcriptional ArsR family regulator